MGTHLRFLFTLSFFLIGFLSFSQERKEINITSGLERIDEVNYPGAVIFNKVDEQVYIVHEGIEMWCDVAFFYKDENFVKAYNNVRINQGDTITMRSRYAEYNGNTQFAFAAGRVNLKSPSSNLQTDTLYFNRQKQQAFYRTGGTLRDTASTITSKVGRYFMESDKYSFIQDVVVRNPEYTINSEQLDFYNEAGHAYLYGPSTIKSETSTVYCERGFYDTRADNGYFVKNSRIDYDNRVVFGDSLYFDRPTSFASATNNIKVVDVENKTVIKGHYAEVYRDKDSVFITKRAMAITEQDNDSLYVHADRIVITGEPEKRIIRGYYDVRMYKSNMSGKSDSIHTDQSTGLTQLLGKPVMWQDLSQMTGDTIHLISDTETEKLDTLKVFNNAFLAQRDSIPLSSDPNDIGFNQVKGEKLIGLFNDNKLSEVNFIKNAESINYMRSETGEMQGVDKSKSASITATLEDNELIEVTNWNQIDGNIYPLSKFPQEERRFPGLNWRGEERLLSIEDLFKGEGPLELTKIQGIPLPEIEEDFFEPNVEEEDVEIPEASELTPKDIENREEDAPSFGIPMNEKATIRKDSLKNDAFRPRSKKLDSTLSKPIKKKEDKDDEG